MSKFIGAVPMMNYRECIYKKGKKCGIKRTMPKCPCLIIKDKIKYCDADNFMAHFEPKPKENK